MSASAARGLSQMARAGPAFRPIEAGEDAEPGCDWGARVENIRNILSQDGHTVARLSAATRRRHGSRSPYFIPATFLYQLKNGVTPHVCQVVALSEATGYRFVDWLRICGFDVQQIPRLQVRLHPERTVLVTPVEDCFELYQPESFLDYETGGSSTAYARTGEASVSSCYLFAKIGTNDALVYPELRPGNIVRVDRRYVSPIRGVDHAAMKQFLWLVEQPSGLTCSQVKWIDDRQIVLLPSRPPWGQWPLRLPTEARILGLADMDPRPLEQVKLQPRAGPKRLEQLSPLPAFPLPQCEEKMRLSDLLRISRARTGSTFRAAHRLTRAVARILGSREYAIALGMLSDYEAMGKLPRHIAKIVSLCAVYCMDIREFMEAAGVHIDDSAKLPLPIADVAREFRPGFHDDAPYPGSTSLVAGYARSANGQP